MKRHPQHMYLFFDTETTGLPRNWNAPASDADNWPRLVQLAWELYDARGTLLREESRIILPKGFVIPADASRVHGITHERALSEGVPVEEVLRLFAREIEKAQVLVAHNMSFDEKIIGAEFLRSGRRDLVADKEKICTMLASVDFCAIEGPRGYKWPKLAELHHTLFGEHFADAHNAAADIRATARCFFELGRRGVIDVSLSEDTPGPIAAGAKDPKHKPENGQLALF